MRPHEQVFLPNYGKIFGKGLAIEPDWDWSKTYPVLKLDMGSCQAASVADLWRKIDTMLRVESERLGVPLREDEPPPGKFQFLMRDMIAAADRKAKEADPKAVSRKFSALPVTGHESLLIQMLSALRSDDVNDMLDALSCFFANISANITVKREK